jgi:hypothetical protein
MIDVRHFAVNAYPDIQKRVVCDLSAWAPERRLALFADPGPDAAASGIHDHAFQYAVVSSKTPPKVPDMRDHQRTLPSGAAFNMMDSGAGVRSSHRMHQTCSETTAFTGQAGGSSRSRDPGSLLCALFITLCIILLYPTGH